MSNGEGGEKSPWFVRGFVWSVKAYFKIPMKYIVNPFAEWAKKNILSAIDDPLRIALIGIGLTIVAPAWIVLTSLAGTGSISWSYNKFVNQLKGKELSSKVTEDLKNCWKTSKKVFKFGIVAPLKTAVYFGVIDVPNAIRTAPDWGEHGKSGNVEQQGKENIDNQQNKGATPAEKSKKPRLYNDDYYKEQNQGSAPSGDDSTFSLKTPAEAAKLAILNETVGSRLKTSNTKTKVQLSAVNSKYRQMQNRVFAHA
ncbi:MAG: hypothetical protein AB1468_00975 [Candidatus Micrarchaeota archaeon]